MRGFFFLFSPKNRLTTTDLEGQELTGDRYILDVVPATVAEIVGDKNVDLQTDIYVNKDANSVQTRAAADNIPEYAAKYIDDNNVVHPRPPARIDTRLSCSAAIYRKISRHMVPKDSSSSHKKTLKKRVISCRCRKKFISLPHITIKPTLMKHGNTRKHPSSSITIDDEWDGETFIEY